MCRLSILQQKLNNMQNSYLAGASSSSVGDSLKSETKTTDKNQKKRLKVAFVTQPLGVTYFPEPTDSIGIWTYELTRLLTEDYEVTVFTPGKNFRDKTDCYEGVRYRYIPMGFDRMLGKCLHRFLKFEDVKRPLFAHFLYSPAYIWQIAGEIRQQHYDLVHIHNFAQFVPIVRRFNPKIKIVLHMHCEWLTQLDRLMNQKRLCHVDLIVGCSNYITEQIRQHFPNFADRTQTLANGVNVERFSQSCLEKRSEAKILYVGRISPEKGIHILLDAFKRVAEKCPQVRLDSIGFQSAIPPEYVIKVSEDPIVINLESLYRCGWKEYLSKWMMSSRFADRVELFDPIPQSQLVDRYRNADIFVFPSVWNEPFGMPIIEAMSAGLPVIATAGGAFSEIVEHEKTGLLVERGNSQALADAIMRLLDDEFLRKSMGNAGRQRVLQLFSWSKIAKNLFNCYQTLA
jgi:glycosyltransferase involved in cell wall biosynthesis